MALASPAQPPGGERAQVGLRPGPPQGRRGASVTVAMGRVPLRSFQGTCCVGADSAVQTVPAARQPCPPGGPCTGCEVHFLQDYQFLGNFGASKGRLVISQVLKKKNWVFQIPSEWQRWPGSSCPCGCVTAGCASSARTAWGPPRSAAGQGQTGLAELPLALSHGRGKAPDLHSAVTGQGPGLPRRPPPPLWGDAGHVRAMAGLRGPPQRLTSRIAHLRPREINPSADLEFCHRMVNDNRVSSSRNSGLPGLTTVFTFLSGPMCKYL